MRNIIFITLILGMGCSLGNSGSIEKNILYYEDGQIERIEYYKNDLPYGKAVNFYPSGDTLCIESFRNGELHGKTICYYENGKTFAEGKGMIFILVADQMMNPSTNSEGQANADKEEFIENSVRNAANTTVHEETSHAKPLLDDPNHETDIEEEHEDYHGESTTSSPSVKDYEKNPEKYKGTTFEKAIKEIDENIQKERP